MKRAVAQGIVAWTVLFLLSNLGAQLGDTQLPGGEVVTPPGYAVPEAGRFVNPWLKADALWYLKIADNGYTDSGDFAFFPAFPMALRFAETLTGDLPIAGFVLASVFLLLGLIAMLRWVDMEASAASKTVWSLALFPAAFFFVAPYAESLFLASGAGALLASSRRRPLLASALGAVAALSRPFGFLFAIPLFFSSRSSRRGWFAPAGPIIAFAGWFSFVAAKTGDLLGAISVQSTWQRRPAFFLDTILQSFRVIGRYAGDEVFAFVILDALSVALAIALTICVYRVMKNPKLGLGLALASAAVLVIVLSFRFDPRPALSFPRFVLSLFFVFPAAAMFLRKRVVWIPLALAGGVGVFLLSAAFAASKPIF